jgi:hypothetical protein
LKKKRTFQNSRVRVLVGEIVDRDLTMQNATTSPLPSRRSDAFLRPIASTKQDQLIQSAALKDSNRVADASQTLEQKKHSATLNSLQKQRLMNLKSSKPKTEIAMNLLARNPLDHPVAVEIAKRDPNVALGLKEPAATTGRLDHKRTEGLSAPQDQLEKTASIAK